MKLPNKKTIDKKTKNMHPALKAGFTDGAIWYRKEILKRLKNETNR